MPTWQALGPRDTAITSLAIFFSLSLTASCRSLRSQANMRALELGYRQAYLCVESKRVGALLHTSRAISQNGLTLILMLVKSTPVCWQCLFRSATAGTDLYLSTVTSGQRPHLVRLDSNAGIVVHHPFDRHENARGHRIEYAVTPLQECRRSLPMPAEQAGPCGKLLGDQESTTAPCLTNVVFPRRPALPGNAGHIQLSRTC